MHILSPTSLTLVQGEMSQLTATVLPSNATHPNLVWSSSNNKNVSVDPTGKITALEVGEATITVTTEDGGFTASCQITVNENPIPIAHTVGIEM